MATSHGKDTQLFMGQYDASAYFRGFDGGTQIGMSDSTVFGLEDRTFVPGLGSATISLEHVFDTVFAETLDDFAKTSGEPFGWFPSGDTLSNRGKFALVKQSGFTVSSPVADLVVGAYEATASGGWDAGVSLHSTTAAETSAGSETSHDGAASSANGGVAFLWMTAFAGTNITVTVEHSANDSTWATLGSFSQLAAIGSQRVLVAAGTTVNRYLRAEWAGTFSSATFAIGFARR